MPKEKITGYQARKKAGLCVRPGCDRKPKLNADGKPRSYCPVHNAANRKNSDAWKARQAAKKPKLVRHKKITTTPGVGEAS